MAAVPWHSTVSRSGSAPLSSYGASLILSSNGTIALGAGGITSYQEVNAEHISIDSPIDLTADNLTTTIQKPTPSGSRANYLYLNGVISGGTSSDPTHLTLSSPGIQSSRSIRLTANNTFTGDVNIQGTVRISNSGAFGDNANTVTFQGSTYFHNDTPVISTTENDFVLSTGSVLMYRTTGGAWNINGDITGGSPASNYLLLGGGSANPLIFNGDIQDFTNKVTLYSRTNVIITKADGSDKVWDSAKEVRFGVNSLGNGTAALKLRGDFTFEKNIFLDDTGLTAAFSQVGQANDGGTPYDAIFNGNTSVLEDDFQALQLTADADGSATFNGMISVVPGASTDFGFDKVGAGTAIVNNRVSQNFLNTDAIGPVSVQDGTLQINSTVAQGGFNADSITVDIGAILGGTGQVNVPMIDVNGAIAPGASIGTLTVDGNVNINGTMTAETDSLSSDLLDVSGTLTLGGASILEIFGSLDPFKSYTLAQAGTLSGTFSAVYLNGALMPVGGPIGSHGLSYLNNAVVLQGVPEPSSLLLLGMGVCVLARRGRRNGKRRVA